MALEVVDAEQGQVGGEREAFRGANPDQERSGQAGPVGDGYRVEAPQLQAGLIKGLSDSGDDCHHVLPGGKLRDDAAVPGVILGL